MAPLRLRWRCGHLLWMCSTRGVMHSGQLSLTWLVYFGTGRSSIWPKAYVQLSRLCDSHMALCAAPVCICSNKLCQCIMHGADWCAQVDVLTGEVRVRQGDVMIDAGHSLNPAVDIGQVLSLRSTVELASRHRSLLTQSVEHAPL